MVEYEKKTSEIEKKPTNSNIWQKNQSAISNKITIFSSAIATFINFQNHLSKSQGQAMHYFPREQLYPNEIIGLTFKIALCKAHSLSVTHIKKIKIASNVPTIVNPNFTWDNSRCTDIGPEKSDHFKLNRAPSLPHRLLDHIWSLFSQVNYCW